MKRTRLIQRIGKSRKSDGPWGNNPFAFGGGMKNGGLNSEAMNILSSFLSFDYMGAAEFEFGALPEALRRIVTHTQESGLVFETISINTEDIKLSWVSERDVVVEHPASNVYIVCSKADKEEVLERVIFLATQGTSGNHPNINLKEPLRLNSTLKLEPAKYGHTVGGIELDNGFLVTSDEDIAKSFFALFGGEL